MASIDNITLGKVETRLPPVIAEWDAGAISPQVFVGSLYAARNVTALKQNGITHVLTVAGRLTLYWPHDTASPLPTRLMIDIVDHPGANILDVLKQCLEFLDTAIVGGGKVLVHCASGVSRSVTVCCAFLMSRHAMTFQDALAQVRLERPQGNPNYGFGHQLQLLEKHSCSIEDANAELMTRSPTKHFVMFGLSFMIL
jgi:dual specificity phosphatase 12